MTNIFKRYTGLSDPLKTQRRVELVVVVLIVLFLLQLTLGALGWMLPSQPAPVFPAQDSLVVTQRTGPGVLDVAQRESIEAKPLFWKTRRPLQGQDADGSEDDAPGQDQAAGKIEGIKLAGIFGAKDTLGIIVIAKGKKHRLNVGDEVIGWELVSAQPTEAVFSSGAERASLSLKRGSVVVVDAAPSAPESGVIPAAQGGASERSGGPEIKHSQATKESTTSKLPPAGDSLSLGGPIVKSINK